MLAIHHLIFQQLSLSYPPFLHQIQGTNTKTAHKNRIEHALICQWCCNLSVPWQLSHLSKTFPVSPSMIASLHDTQTPYPRVVGGHHIPSSGVARDFVVVGFPDRNCYSMVSEVLFVISLSHLNCTETYST